MDPLWTLPASRGPEPWTPDGCRRDVRSSLVVALEDVGVDFIGAKVATKANEATSAAENMVNNILSAVRTVADALAVLPAPFNVGNVLGQLPGNISLPRIQVSGTGGGGAGGIRAMASGGIVKGGHGGFPAIIGEKQHDELVMPLKRGARGMGGGGVVVNITAPHYVGSPQQLAAAVQEAMIRLGKSNSAVFGGWA